MADLAPLQKWNGQVSMQKSVNLENYNNSIDSNIAYLCNGLRFTSTTTSTALEAPGSIATWGELLTFISTFFLFPVSFGAVTCPWN